MIKKNQTRVAFCIRDLNVGGVESVLTRTLERLEKYRDLEIVVVTYTPVRERWRGWFDAHKNICVRVLYPCRFFGTDLPHFFIARILKHAMRDVYRFVRRACCVKRMLHDIDVVVDYYDFDCAREVAKLNVPRIAWWHSSSNKFYNGRYIKNIKNYNRFVVLTDAFANELCEKYPEIRDRVLRIYNPIDMLAVRAHADAASTPSGKYFACVSRLVNGKDIETLCRAFDVFMRKNKNPNVDLRILGDGYARARYESFAKTLGAKSHIIFMGNQSNPFGVMRGAIANILSSRGEGFALVLIEAAALGTLNIASDCAYGPREILMNGRAGLLFPVGDADALATHMDDVFNNRVDASKMISCATKNMSRFDIDKIATQIKSEIINQKS